MKIVCGFFTVQHLICNGIRFALACCAASAVTLMVTSATLAFLWGFELLSVTIELIEQNK